MSYGLEDVATVREFVIGAYIKLINARILIYDQGRADYCHVLALFLFLLFEDRHVAVLEQTLQLPQGQ